MRASSSANLATFVPVPAAVVAGLVAAGVPWSPAGQERPRGVTPTCVTAQCHAGIVERRVMHGPVAQRKCDACHVVADAATHRFTLAAATNDLCRACHPMQDRTFVHTPVKQGNCTGCHDPHGSDHATMLVADPTQGLCLGCHREEVTPKFVHGPVASGACILCHEAHSSWQPNLLTEEPVALCLGCHAEIAFDPVRDRYRHEPVETGCLECHDAHASDVRHHLHAAAPQLCFRCHEDTRDTLRTAGVVHGAAVQEGGCQVCHAAHASSLPALQRREEIDLCLGCHDGSLRTAADRPLTDMVALLRENPDHHGPIRDGSCTACHLPHASETPLLLRQAYPPEFYAAYEPARYALCFECHLPEMVRSRRGTGVTGFRDGDRNLHWLHVNREKGRTCRACHEVHASRNPFHVRDAVPFGDRGWALEIRFERMARGGSCSPGCHQQEAYDRGPEPSRPDESTLLSPIGNRP